MRTANSFRICTPMSALSRNLSLPSWPCLQDPPTCSHRLTKNRKRIYDCELEKEAFSEIRRPGSMDASHGLVRFSGDFEGSAYEAMQKVLATLYSNEEAMKQIKYPKATRFGCSGKLLRHKHTGMRRMEWTCIYDQKYGVTLHLVTEKILMEERPAKVTRIALTIQVQHALGSVLYMVLMSLILLLELPVGHSWCASLNKFIAALFTNLSSE
ncbi:hypothetical protein Y032_0222g2617 [Ancylostoma ceylanicum]|uniref:Uncharacterized protein n=1 Tax=Ancylostoma ceylanicum TaxID=53326 RepID=A0A016SIT0_9BILA|nr:hypothetical protein Y032_0222g2617 [Ancylostoma ceylanicum]